MTYNNSSALSVQRSVKPFEHRHQLQLDRQVFPAFSIFPETSYALDYSPSPSHAISLIAS